MLRLSRERALTASDCRKVYDRCDVRERTLEEDVHIVTFYESETESETRPGRVNQTKGRRLLRARHLQQRRVCAYVSSMARAYQEQRLLIRSPTENNRARNRVSLSNFFDMISHAMNYIRNRTINNEICLKLFNKIV